MEYLPLILQQDANKLYPDIINCQVKSPPHWSGKVSHTFFLTKRNWFNSSIDLSQTITNETKWLTVTLVDPIILDAIEFNDNWYYIVKYTANEQEKVALVLNEETELIPLLDAQYQKWINYKFKITEGVTWDVVKEGHGSGAVENTIAYFTDTSASFDSSYAGKYIYFYDQHTSNVAGVGQSGMLWGWTWNKIEVSTWWFLEPKNVEYKIFTDYGQVLSLLFTDWIYHIHNHDNVLQAKRFWQVIDFEYTKSTIFTVTSSYRIYASYPGYFNNLSDTRSYIGVAPGVFKLNAFKSYIIWLADDRVYVIEGSEVTDVKDSVINRTTTYKMFPVSSSIWLLDAKAISDYNNWLYFISSDKKVVSFGLQSSGWQGYEVSIEDMGINIQHKLDTIGEKDNIWLAINQNEIQITHKIHNWWSNIYIYDQYYKFWHYWNTDSVITGLVPGIKFRYFGSSLFLQSNQMTDDNKEYNQNIRVIAWEEDIFSLKNYICHKVYIWQNTDPDTIIRYKCNLWSQTYTYAQELNGTSYLIDSDKYDFNWLLWAGIVWYSLYGGFEDKNKLKRILIADTGTIEVPINLTCGIMEISISWDFEFGGMLLWFDRLESHITPIDSVVGIM